MSDGDTAWSLLITLISVGPALYFFLQRLNQKCYFKAKDSEGVVILTARVIFVDLVSLVFTECILYDSNNRFQGQPQEGGIRAHGSQRTCPCYCVNNTLRHDPSLYDKRYWFDTELSRQDVVLPSTACD